MYKKLEFTSDEQIRNIYEKINIYIKIENEEGEREINTDNSENNIYDYSEFESELSKKGILLKRAKWIKINDQVFYDLKELKNYFEKKTNEDPRYMDYDIYLTTDNWKNKKEIIIKRDAGKCRICSSTNSLNVHHNTYKTRGVENSTDLITLCNSCHNKYHKSKKTDDFTYEYKMNDELRAYKETEEFYKKEDKFYNSCGMCGEYSGIIHSNFTKIYYNNENVLLGQEKLTDLVKLCDSCYMIFKEEIDRNEEYLGD